MTGEGTVISVSPGEAIVRISKSSACGHDCASCGACSNPSYEIKVADNIGASIGDRVVIEGVTSKILWFSFLLYMLPVFILIAAALLCEAYSAGYYSIPIFAVLLLLWFLIIKLANKKAKMHNVITKIIA